MKPWSWSYREAKGAKREQRRPLALLNQVDFSMCRRALVEGKSKTLQQLDAPQVRACVWCRRRQGHYGDAPNIRTSAWEGNGRRSLSLLTHPAQAQRHEEHQNRHLRSCKIPNNKTFLSRTYTFPVHFHPCLQTKTYHITYSHCSKSRPPPLSHTHRTQIQDGLSPSGARCRDRNIA